MAITLTGVAHPVFGPVGALLAYPVELPSRPNDFGVLVWDLQTQRQIAEVPTGLLVGMAFSGDGHVLVTCGHNQTVSRWQLPESRKLSSFSFRDVLELRDRWGNFAVTRDARTAAVADQQGNLLVADLDTGKICWTMAGTVRDLRSLAFSPEGRHVMVAGREEGFCKFSPDGNSIAALLDSCVLHWWQVPTREKIAAATAEQKARNRQR